MKIKTNLSGSRKKKPIAVRLEFHDENARTVSIVGTFNDWNPKTTPMLTIGPGQWVKELALSPGIYEYQYVVDGKWINDPQAGKSTPNPLGGRNSVLVVEQNHTRSGTTFRPANSVRKTPGENGRQS
jgi:1,4-alpha-glucan branching enzyme